MLEYNWSAAQVGFAVLFTVRASGPRANWSTVEDVIFQHNLVRHAAGGINMDGYDDAAPTQQSRNLAIRNNLFYDIDHRVWGGNGTFLQIGDEPVDVTVEQNTIVQSGNLVTAHGGTRAARRPIRGFRFRNNIAWHNDYGVYGDGVGVGEPAMAVYFPDAEFAGNVIAGGQENRYPGGNRFPPVADVMAQFVDPDAGNYRLRPGSRARRVSTDGGPAGADVDVLFRMIGGVGLR